MNEDNWRILTSVIKLMENAPLWLRQFGDLDYKSVSSLSPLGSEIKGNFAAPAVIEKVVAKDFLDFLQEQIRLKARGIEWTKILQARFAALQPFVGKTIITVNLHKMPNSVTLYIDPETKKIIHFEIYN
jgi:hypothetical protein